jgi:hypothetical protein
MRGIIFILFIGMLVACTRNQNQETAAAETFMETELSPEGTVVNFLKWYRDNDTSLANDLVLNNGEGRDTSKNYAVNFPATEKYLQTLKSTGMISVSYIDKWRYYFKSCELHFIQQPSKEGPPPGFDYDFILQSQEDPGLDELDKVKFELLDKELNSEQVIIKFPSGYQYKYFLSRSDRHWLIDDIELVKN